MVAAQGNFLKLHVQLPVETKGWKRGRGKEEVKDARIRNVEREKQRWVKRAAGCRKDRQSGGAIEELVQRQEEMKRQ